MSQSRLSGRAPLQIIVFDNLDIQCNIKLIKYNIHNNLLTFFNKSKVKLLIDSEIFVLLPKKVSSLDVAFFKNLEKLDFPYFNEEIQNYPAVVA